MRTIIKLKVTDPIPDKAVFLHAKDETEFETGKVRYGKEDLKFRKTVIVTYFYYEVEAA